MLPPNTIVTGRYTRIWVFRWAEHIRALTAGFDSKLADVWNPLSTANRQILKLTEGWPRRLTWKSRAAGASQWMPSPAMATSTKWIAFGAYQPIAFRVLWLRLSVIFNTTRIECLLVMRLKAYKLCQCNIIPGTIQTAGTLHGRQVHTSINKLHLQIYVLDGRMGARRAERYHTSWAIQATHGSACRGTEMVNQKSKTLISNTTKTKWIYFTTIPCSSEPPGRGLSNGVGPSQGWPIQLKLLYKRQRKHESIIPRISAFQESSVNGNAHLLQAFPSQSSFDIHIKRRLQEGYEWDWLVVEWGSTTRERRSHSAACLFHSAMGSESGGWLTPDLLYLLKRLPTGRGCSVLSREKMFLPKHCTEI